jgi:hypothetical protein
MRGGIGVVCGLVKDSAIEVHHGVSREHNGVLWARCSFVSGRTDGVGDRVLVGQGRLVYVSWMHRHCEAQVGEDFPPAGTGTREVDHHF